MATEKRLIDAHEVLLRNDLAKNRSEVFRSYGKWLIDNAPTVDAVEVVHGWWKKIAYHPYYCSNCGEIAPLDFEGESHYRSNYCPNCGAKMDGDGNGT